jgi:hypothetical protein
VTFLPEYELPNLCATTPASPYDRPHNAEDSGISQTLPNSKARHCGGGISWINRHNRNKKKNNLQLSSSTF